MKDLLVSIVVPIYNMEKYVGECVKSLVEQTYQNIEILLIDDGSTDSSPEIIDKLALSDQRIRVIHKENGGTAMVRNLGVESAKGEYILFIDADDWLSNDCIEECVKEIKENNLDVVRFNYVKEFLTYSEQKQNTFLKLETYSAEECQGVARQIIGLIDGELAHPENQNFLASACFNLYNRQIILDNNIKFTDMSKIGAFEDGLFNIEYFLHINSFKFIDKPFYHYRKYNEGSCTSNYRKDFLKRQLYLFEKISALILDNDNQDFKRAFESRVALSTMEMCLNALKNKDKFKVKYSEVKGILKDNTIRQALKKLRLKPLPFKFKIYYFFAKHKMVFSCYMLTSMLKKLRDKRN